MTTRSLREQLASLREDIQSLRPAEPDRAKLDEIVRRIDAIVEEVPPDLEVEEPQPKKMYSILEWEGVGKEFWSKIDVDEYIRKERESWD